MVCKRFAYALRVCCLPCPHTQTLTSGRVGLAFGLVIAAGFSTCLGASIAFFVKVTNKRILAGALSLSAGVMMYVRPRLQ